MAENHWAWWWALLKSVGGLSAFIIFRFVLVEIIHDFPELAGVDLGLLRYIAISNVIAGGILFVCLLRQKNYFGDDLI